MKRAAALLVITLWLQLAVGADYFWIPNSNWDEPGNWALGRPPCGGEVASFAATPTGSLIYLKSDVTVGAILLPANGKIVLKPSVTIRFSSEASCTIDNTDPLVADVKDGQEDVFTGIQDNLWECPENWLQADNLPADRPPCREDNAVFERDAAYSFVTSKADITVNSLIVRGVELKSLDALTNPSLEFKVKVAIEPRCADDPSLCPCPSQGSCESPQKASSKAALAAGVSVAIFVIVAITVTIVVIVVIIYVRRRHGSYTKDDLMEPDENIVYKSEHSKASKDAVAFDNPLYDATTGEVHLVGYEVKEEPVKQQLAMEEDTKSSSSGKTSGKEEDLKPILDDPEWETF